VVCTDAAGGGGGSRWVLALGAGDPTVAGVGGTYIDDDLLLPSLAGPLMIFLSLRDVSTCAAMMGWMSPRMNEQNASVFANNARLRSLFDSLI